MKHSKNEKKKGSGRRQHVNPQKLIPIQDQLCVGQTLRFITTNNFGGSFAVTTSFLLDAWFIAGTATTAYQLFDFVRLKKVTIRGMAVANPRVVGVSLPSPPNITVGVEFYGLTAGTFGGGKQKSDTAIGYDQMAAVEISPDPRSQVAQYQASNGNNMFAIRAVDQDGNPVKGVVVDVDLVYRNSADVNPAALGVARAGLQPGTIYFGGLDGQNDANSQCRSAFVPRA